MYLSHQAIESFARDAKCPYELSVLIQPGHECTSAPPDTFSNGQVSVTSPVPLPAAPVQLRLEQAYNNFADVPCETFGEASALIGDQRMLITVPTLVLRCERATDAKGRTSEETPNGDHPGDVQWYTDAGRTF